jgi:hypothetical protein
MSEIGKDEKKLTEEVLNTIVKSLIDNGKLIVVGLGGHGKTTAVMHLTRHLMTMPEYKSGKLIIRIGDSANVWKWSFDSIPFVDVTKKRSVPEDEPILLLDLGYTDTSMNSGLIENLVRGDYYQQRDSISKNQGKLIVRRIYVLEEIQNLLGSYSLSGKTGEFWLKVMSEGRNYGQYVIGLGQRLGDISAKIVERTRYFLLGAISGENDANKIRRMFGTERGQRVVNALLGLSKSQFLWLDKEQPENSFKIYFPAFTQTGKPFEYGRKQNGNITVERVFL